MKKEITYKEEIMYTKENDRQYSYRSATISNDGLVNLEIDLEEIARMLEDYENDIERLTIVHEENKNLLN